MGVIEMVAERKIQEAIDRGDFDNLSGKGKPLPPQDDRVPESLRSAYKILKNANVLPEEVQIFRKIRSLKDLLNHCDDAVEIQSVSREISELELRYELLMERRLETQFHRKYRPKIIRRFH